MPNNLDFKQLTDPKLIAEFIARQILEHLQAGQRVLWLVTGGSSIPVNVAAAKLVAPHPHERLVVTLTDERYGPVGHADSNWQKLLTAGFSLPQAKLYPILTGQDLTETTRTINEALKKELSQAQYSLGLFGIGADGHTAGILPHSVAVASSELAMNYQGPDFTRITITPSLISRLDEAIAVVMGSTKWPALANLATEKTTTDQPAQILKQVKKLTIFSDYQPQ